MPYTMTKKKALKFTFIVNFRGGIYCAQVDATNVNESILQWINQIEKERDQIKFLGNKIISELKKEVQHDYNIPVPLNGLKNIWFVSFSTRKGSFLINIVKTASK